MLKPVFWQGVCASRGWGFALFLWQRFHEVRVPQVSASLTFTTLLALVPILTVTLVVVSAFPMFAEFSESVVRFIHTMIVPQGADTILSYLATFKAQASNLTAIGIIFLGITSLLLVQTIDQTFNRIWHVKTQRPFWMQFLLYWALLTFGPLAFGAALSVWGLLLKQSHLEEIPWLSAVVQISSSILLNTAMLWLLYRLVPNRYVPALHALIGASITAILLELARRGFAYYVSSFNSYQLIYGAFAAIPVFLIWLNLLWMLLLTGAVITAALSYWKGEAFRRPFGAREQFDCVLKILLMLHQAQKNSRVLRVQDFRREINMGYDELGDLLEKLAQYGYVYEGKQGWVLKTSAAHIQLAELFQCFVYRMATQPQDATAATMTTVLQPCVAAVQMTLLDFEQKMQEQSPDFNIPSGTRV